ncbi:MAG: iron-containing alcohol dehydrogenase, partial [Sutterella wadsworthensis]
MQFVDFAPVKLVFGPGRLEALRTEPLPGTRALLLTSNGRSMERIGALARVTAILEERGVAVVHMGVVEPNPTVSTVMKVAARMKDERCDFLVALGGGSVMDCAKISGLMATNPGELWDYVQGGTGGRRAFEHDPLPLVAITTTAGTGSEVDAGGVIT